MKMLVRKLPETNWTLVRSLSEFLKSITNNSNTNKMSVRNIGIVFSATLSIPVPVFSSFLTDFDLIFGDKFEEDMGPPSFEISVTQPSPLTPEDIRSPRRQLFSDIPTPSYNQDSFPKQMYQAPSYGQVPHDSRVDNDTGFIPLQPSYEPPSSNPPPPPQYGQIHQSSVHMPGPEYSVMGRKPGVNGSAKARRRESSMMFGSAGAGLGISPKISIPALRGDSGQF